MQARANGGTFILRIDDTDQERSKQEYIDQIQRDLEWLGLTWDRIEYQSKRLDRYAEAADRLRGMGRFYEAFETPTELDLKRKKQLNMGRPPVYDRAALALSDEDKARLRAERGEGVWRFLLDQERIDKFAEVTGDLQWIHTDPQRAEAESPYGATIAHGYLTLSLIPHLTLFTGIAPEGTVMAINYGSDKVRFLQPVPSGAAATVILAASLSASEASSAAAGNRSSGPCR